jgi:hypothetical protein
MCDEGTAHPADKQMIVNSKDPKKGQRLGNGWVSLMHGRRVACNGDRGMLQNVVLEDGVTMLLGKSGKHEPSGITSLKTLSPNKTTVQTSNLMHVLAYQNIEGLCRCNKYTDCCAK